jgi:hypothetical protein
VEWHDVPVAPVSDSDADERFAEFFTDATSLRVSDVPVRTCLAPE